MEEQILGGILGLCAGDAAGVPVEFQSRQSLRNNPVTDLRSGGTHGQPAGTWSDDASMALCLLDSLTSGRVDYEDIMGRFRMWLDAEAYTPHGRVFDAGMTCQEAVIRFTSGTPALLCGGTAERDNGNGALMRILPLAFYLYRRFGGDFFAHEEAVTVIHNTAALTHGHRRSQIACGIYLSAAGALLEGRGLPEALSLGAGRAWSYYSGRAGFKEELAHYGRLRDPGFAALPEAEINSGGYVVDTLEAAFWCLLNTDSYETCVLRAVNLGEDTDTTAAVAGGLAGLHYGVQAIPRRWREQLARLDYLTELCGAFARSLESLE